VARPSLPEIYRSLPIPQSAGFLRKLLAFAGPGYLVAVGLMDPGNWATDLAGGSKYNYALLSVTSGDSLCWWSVGFWRRSVRG
jgi:manganese transport protein